MTPIKTFDTRVEADLARIALRGEGIAATVVGVDVALSGGAQGVQLLVADDQVEVARKILEKPQPLAGKAKR
jgi:Putative prokaryotic signal transducing protein